MNRSSYHLTDTLIGHPEYGSGTAEFLQTKNGPFIFANKLSTPPTFNRDPPNMNYLSKSAQATGLTFMGIALLLILCSFVLVLKNQMKAEIRHAQPFFLHILLFGSAVMSFAILTQSFDESYGWSTQMLSAACVATPWLVALGYNAIYLALFCKLWRVNKIMDATRRRAVHAINVVGPFVIAMVATIAILVAWTVVDPLRWEREVIDQSTGETYGQCQSSNGGRFYIPIAVLMALSTLACGYMAFKCQDIDPRFVESTWIYYTFFVQFQVMLIGVPVLISLQDASADAAYLGSTMLIFVIVVTAVMLMIGPKVAAVYGYNVTKRSRMGGTGSAHVTGTGWQQPDGTGSGDRNTNGRPGMGNGGASATSTTGAKFNPPPNKERDEPKRPYSHSTSTDSKTEGSHSVATSRRAGELTSSYIESTVTIDA